MLFGLRGCCQEDDDGDHPCVQILLQHGKTLALNWAFAIKETRLLCLAAKAKASPCTSLFLNGMTAAER